TQGDLSEGPPSERTGEGQAPVVPSERPPTQDLVEIRVGTVKVPARVEEHETAHPRVLARGAEREEAAAAETREDEALNAERCLQETHRLAGLGDARPLERQVVPPHPAVADPREVEAERGHPFPRELACHSHVEPVRPQAMDQPRVEENDSRS